MSIWKNLLGGESKRMHPASPGSQRSSAHPICETRGVVTNNTTPSPETSDPTLTELLAYLGSGGPAEIETDWSATCLDNRARLYEALASDPRSPSLTRFFLKPNGSAANAPYLIVTTGERSQFDRDWNYNKDEIRDRVLQELSLPVGTWAAMTGERSASHANHSKPGCSLASTATFDNLARTIFQGQYAIERVVRPAHAPQKSVQRWDVMIFGEEAVRPDLACHFCGDDRVAIGNNGSHLRCCRCGAVYCRRNCQASIHGQCPRCGEADRINYVE